MHLSLIVAMSENGVIGHQNKLPWHIPEELKYFRKVTLGKTIIMGRKTFESIGHKPLPHRRNIVISRDPHFQAPGCEVVSGVEDALKKVGESEEVMIIGGSSVYELFLPKVSRLYITRVHGNYTGDAYFPPINWDEWALTFEEAFEQFSTQVWDKKD